MEIKSPNISARTISFFKAHYFSILLLASAASGAGAGVIFRDRILWIEPFGELFLNLLFTAVVPLIFFSIASAICGLEDLRTGGKAAISIVLVFLVTGALASIFMIAVLKIFPPDIHLSAAPLGAQDMAGVSGKVSWAHVFSVPDFRDLMSRKNMPALIVFSILTGMAALKAKEKGKAFSDFLTAGNEVMMKVIGLIMIYAPVGIGAFFAAFAARSGTGIGGTYWSIFKIYYPAALIYFLAAMTVCSWWARGRRGVAQFWTHIPAPALTAFATSSSLAAVPVNLQACDRIGIRKNISRLVVPLGASVHMDGSCLAAVLKISVLFSVYGMSFEGIQVYALAAGVSLVSAAVMGGIPGGGLIGEVFILQAYGFPPESLPWIALIGILVDPPATMVNSAGDTAAAMVVEKIVYGKARP